MWRVTSRTSRSACFTSCSGDVSDVAGVVSHVVVGDLAVAFDVSCVVVLTGVGIDVSDVSGAAVGRSHITVVVAGAEIDVSCGAVVASCVVLRYLGITVINIFDIGIRWCYGRRLSATGLSSSCDRESSSDLVTDLVSAFGGASSPVRRCDRESTFDRPRRFSAGPSHPRATVSRLSLRPDVVFRAAVRPDVVFRAAMRPDVVFVATGCRLSLRPDVVFRCDFIRLSLRI